MTRKWWGLAVGIVGLASILVGGVALLARPAGVAYPTGDLETSVAVIPPEVVALEGLRSITVTSPATFDVWTARPIDAYAWAIGYRTSVVRGLSTWDEVKVDLIVTSGSDPADIPSDLWRNGIPAFEVTTIQASTVEPGVAIVVVSKSGDNLGDITLEVGRDRGNGWAWPVVAIGLSLVAIGLVLFAAEWLGFRTLFKKVGSWVGRKRKAKVPGVVAKTKAKLVAKRTKPSAGAKPKEKKP